MTVIQGNQWDCDNPDCSAKAFVPRNADNQLPDKWLNTEADGGNVHITACGAACLGPAIAHKTAKPPAK